MRETKKYKEAEWSYKRALATDPKNIQIYLDIDETLQLSSRTDEAEKYYRKVLKQSPENPEALRKLGNLLKNMHRYSDAEVYYQRAIKQMPAHPDLQGDYGDLLQRLKQFDKAREFYEKAILARPDDPVLHYRLATVLDQIERHDLASKEYERVIDLNGQNWQAREALTQFLVDIKQLSKEDQQAIGKLLNTQNDLITFSRMFGKRLDRLSAVQDRVIRKLEKLERNQQKIHDVMEAILERLTGDKSKWPFWK